MQNEINVTKQIGSLIRIIKVHFKFDDHFIVQVFVPGFLDESRNWVFVQEFNEESDANEWAVMMQDLIESNPKNFVESA